MAKILVVDDDAGISKSLYRILSRNNYEVRLAQDGFEALDAVDSFQPDLVLLDIMLPDMNGFTTCERIRSKNSEVGVIFLSAKGDPFDKATGLRIGGDDYLSKPFDTDELLARIQAVLRRMTVHYPEASDDIRLGNLTIHPKSYSVERDGVPVELSAREFEILSLLASYPGQVFSRSRIYQGVWGADNFGDDKAVVVYIRKIREKIEDDPKHPEHLVTIWGVGYKLV